MPVVVIVRVGGGGVGFGMMNGTGLTETKPVSTGGAVGKSHVAEE
jgi:hypothetical protein